MKNEKIDERTYLEKKFPIVKFNSHEYPFLIMDSYLKNPDSNFNDVFIEFVEIEKTGSPKENAIEFEFRLDLITWQENGKSQRPDAIQRLVDEFIGKLPDQLKSRYKNNYEYLKKSMQNAAKFSASLDEIRKGEVFSYNEVFGDKKSILFGGEAVGFSFECKGRSFFIEDFYCMNPECKCEEGKLVFLELKKKESSITVMFYCIFSFKSGLKIEDHPGCSEEEAKKIFNEWQKSDPDVIDVMQCRYEDMKQVGERLIKQG